MARLLLRLQNRYVTPLGFMVNLFGMFYRVLLGQVLTLSAEAYLSPYWTSDVSTTNCTDT